MDCTAETQAPQVPSSVVNFLGRREVKAKTLLKKKREKTNAMNIMSISIIIIHILVRRLTIFDILAVFAWTIGNFISSYLFTVSGHS